MFLAIMFVEKSWEGGVKEEEGSPKPETSERQLKRLDLGGLIHEFELLNSAALVSGKIIQTVKLS